MHSIGEAGDWLASLINRERSSDWNYSRIGLAPIRALLARLGHPEKTLRFIHVAGSKGKGSTVLLAEAMLSAAGERVGAFTSPHLERWTERVRVGGAEVEARELVAALSEVRPHVEALRREQPEDAPSFFDATTAAALVCFRAAGVERALLEVGLGGRLDSTNAVSPEVACITSIELEHTDKLGDTLAAIAAEKAGILKPGVPAVTGALPAEADAVVRARAQQLEAPLARLGEHFGCELLAGDALARRVRFWDKGDGREAGFDCEAELAVRGRHQLGNAALALACVRRTAGRGGADLAQAVREGLARVQLPARCESVGNAPLLVVDAAHTLASARSLAEELAAWAPGELHLVLSISDDKSLEPFFEALLPRAASLTLTRADLHRSRDPESMAAEVHERLPELAVRVVPDPELALREVRARLTPDAVGCATGSVYLAGIARRVWREPIGGADARE